MPDRADADRASTIAYVDASLRAEGLEPSADAVADGEAYVRGEITLDELESRADERVRAILARRSR
ncbi:antitoxin VbhA family protein [Fodinicola acaciae]|uniref:antitoxin VbhA family protein n=1 Tax=Fodinicola acaciae TaxID=2681555 RepID=UPI0013D4AB6A